MTASLVLTVALTLCTAYGASRSWPDAPTVNCTFPPPSFTTDGAGVTHVTVTGCSPWLRTGEPVLPFHTVRLLLPSGYTATGLIVRATAPALTFHGIRQLEIAREPAKFPAATALPTLSTTQPDSSPKEHSLAELLSVQRQAGYTIALIQVFPVVYNAEKQLLTFTPEVTVEVLLTLSLATTIPPSARTADQLRIKSSVINPEIISTYAKASLGMIGDPATNYLLVTSTALLPSFQPLITAKQAAGLTVITETMEAITNHYTGVDAAEKLRNCIRQHYINSGTQYVLLGGDTKVVPYRGVYARCSGLILNLMPSDLYFACLDGSWNNDGDGIWGEPNDGEFGGDVDLLAELCVGRAPVDTPAEVTNFVQKTLAAQQLSERKFRADFAGEVLNASGAQGGSALETLLPAFTNSLCPVNWLDDRPALTVGWMVADAINMLNQSPPLVAHFGHGSDYVDDTTVLRLSVSDIASLTNPEPFLLYSTACNAGAFDNNFGLGDCIAEELVKGTAHGAFAVVTNTREGWYDNLVESRYSGEFQKRFFDRLLAAHATEIGVAHELARQDLLGSVETYGSSMPYRWCTFGITLFGDPHSIIEVPLSLRFQAPPAERVVTWNSWSNTTYSIYRTIDLAASPGFCIASNIVATPPLNTYIDSVSALPRAFYRVTTE